jgi:hypothetical protein
MAYAHKVWVIFAIGRRHVVLPLGWAWRYLPPPPVALQAAGASGGAARGGGGAGGGGGYRLSAYAPIPCYLCVAVAPTASVLKGAQLLVFLESPLVIGYWLLAMGRGLTALQDATSKCNIMDLCLLYRSLHSQ